MTNPDMLISIIILSAAALVAALWTRSKRAEARAKERIAALNAELERARVQLERLDAAKSEFIAIAGHQLRAPLTIIKGYVAMLLEGTLGETPQLVQDSMQKAYTSTNQLARLIGDLLDLSRIEAGRMRYDFRKVHLADVVTEILKGLEVTAKAKGLTLTERTIDTRRSAVYADHDRLREAVMNLVDNAINYTARGRVSVELIPEKRDGRKWITLAVTDSGIGIATADLGKVFTKFTRTEEARRLRPDGMGLGLYIVKKIVEDHGGRVAVTSPGLGQGSAFSVTLPAL